LVRKSEKYTTVRREGNKNDLEKEIIGRETFRGKRKRRELKMLSITSDIRRLMTLRGVRDI